MISQPVRSGGWRAAFGGLMILSMAAATMFVASLGVIATFLIDDLDVSRAEVGVLAAVVSVVAAFGSPRVGHVVDALGGKRSLVVMFVVSALGLVGLAASPVYAVMFVPVLLAAVAQAASNPATNKLIAAFAPPGRRALITGVKQSGVQFGIFLSGVALPLLADAFGWRVAVACIAAVPVAALPVVALLLPRDPPSATTGLRASGPLPRSITVLAVYGGLMGFGASYTFLVPLFAEEALDLTPAIGGLAIGLTGLVAIVGRIAWARWAERRTDFFGALAIIAGFSVVAALVFGAAEWVATPLLWAGVFLTGLTSSSWNSVGNLAVMAEAGTEKAGRASGVMMLGFLVGLGTGPPIFGWSVDVTGSYTPMWITCLVTLAAAFLVAAGWARRGDSTVRP